MDWTQTVNDIYQQELGRQADPSGMASFTNLLNQGMTGEQMREALRSSPEGIARYSAPAPAPAAPPPPPAPENQFITTNYESGEGFWTQGAPAPTDPNTGQVGTYVNYGGDIDQFVPLTLATPSGQYTTTNYESGEGYFNPFTPEQASAAAAAIESNRQSELQRASQILAENPLGVSGNLIQTRYGDVDVSTFFPIAAAGQPITGDTPAQLFDPQSKMPVFLSNPNDPFSYTYDNTGIPAISGTVAQQAALYKPIEQKGVFGSIGADLLSAIKDPYFRNFAIAAASMAAAAALAPAAAGSVGGTTAGGAGATAFPVSMGGAGAGGFGSTLTGLGATGAEAAAGFGSVGSALGAGAAGTGLTGLGTTMGGAGSALGATAPTASTLGGLFQKGADVLAGPYGSLIKGGLTLGGLAAASALKPKTDTSGAGGAGMSAEELSAIVALMPSMVGQYTSQAGQGGMGLPTGGYNPSMDTSMANLFPGFALPTQGPFYGAGRFGENYNPAPMTTLV
jgi:hypothetical protein